MGSHPLPPLPQPGRYSHREPLRLPNPASEGFAVATENSPESTAALYGLSMLHTLFNTINTLLLVWFTGWIGKAVSWIIRTPENQEKEVFRLKYISAGPLATPELSVEQAFDEIIHFAQISKNGAAYARSAVNETNAYNAEERLNSLRNNLRDAMIEDIEDGTNNYQTSVYYMDIINQYERMGDFMINISQDLERAFVKR